MRSLSTQRLQRRYAMRPTKLNIRILIILVVFVLALVRVSFWFIRQDDGFQFVELLDEEYNDVSESDGTQGSDIGGTFGEENSDREVDYEFDERNSDFDDTKNGAIRSNNSEEYYYDASEGKGREIRKEWSVHSKVTIETSLKNNTTNFVSMVAGNTTLNKTNNVSRNPVRGDDFESDTDVGSEVTGDDVEGADDGGRNDTLEIELTDEARMNQIAMVTAERGDAHQPHSYNQLPLTVQNGDSIHVDRYENKNDMEHKTIENREKEE
ncbi:uncharacterized protein LOC121426388 [Lytechinus variegatus]|uniref:uncharacterized protein LOC121426388 n=1 Tax=Lytechinus variegatus TaxID=7654 RepID=UPI001BB2530E|nr:uncharacterized protein LOC121426388 [Lytechinus variegatus]